MPGCPDARMGQKGITQKGIGHWGKNPGFFGLQVSIIFRRGVFSSRRQIPAGLRYSCGQMREPPEIQYLRQV